MVIGDSCPLCADATRDATMILVVEEPLEVVAFERAHYRGTYHVLHGVLSPIDGLGPEQLRIRELLERVKRCPPSEVIIATDPDVEGEATASYLRTQLSPYVTSVTRLAHGLPVGADIEFADQLTLKEALLGRRGM